MKNDYLWSCFKGADSRQNIVKAECQVSFAYKWPRRILYSGMRNRKRSVREYVSISILKFNAEGAF